MASSSSPKKRGCVSQLPDPVVTAMVLKSPNYSNKVLSGLHHLRSIGVLCDFTLVADATEFMVHRSVMVACSDYFYAMMTGEMRESKELRVELRGVSATGLEALVEFAYTGVLNLDLDNIEEVLSTASHLQMTEAVDLCCQFMDKAITIENCVDIVNMADLFCLEKSKTVARKFMLENFEALAESDQYKQLTSDQLCSLLDDNRLKVNAEYRLFELVLQWIKMDRPAREEYTRELMGRIRLPLLSGEELVEKVSKVDIMQQNKACGELLMQAKDYHIVVSKQPLLQSPQTQVRSIKPSLIMCHSENLESYDLDLENQAFLKEAPIPLYNPCVVVVDNFMYACGGKYDSNENNEIATARCFRYDPRFDSWYELPVMNEARKDFAMVTYRDCLYCIAGQDENMVMCTVECFSIPKNDWKTCMPLDHAVYGHAAATCKDLIYISGGLKFDGHCSNVLSYDPSKDQWTEEAPLLRPRSNHNMVEVLGHLYVLGGNIEDSYGFPVPVCNIEMYDPGTGAWTICEDTVNIREAGACVYDDKIYIVGGLNGQHYFSDLIQCYDVSKDHLTILDRFATRIYGRACCILILPQYV